MRGPSEHSSAELPEPPDFGDDFFERMVAAASDAVVTADDEGVIVYANEAVEDLLGYAPDDLRGREFTEFVPSRFRDRYEGWLRRFADGDAGTPLSDDTFEATGLTADDEETRLSVSSFVHGTADRPLFTGFLRNAPDRDESLERLREEEALVEEIFDTSPIALAVRDPDGELLRANDRAAELVGVGADRLPYDAEADETKADDANGGDANEPEWAVYDRAGNRLSREEYPVSRVLETGDPVYNEEILVEQPSGKRVHLSVSATPVRDDGEIERVVSTAEDITELKETQYELEQRRDELETELSEVFSRIQDAFFALDTDWNFTYVNDEAEELLLRSEEDIVGDCIWDVFPEAVDSAFQREYERAMRTQEPTSFEEYYPPLSTWFEVRAYPSETGLSVYFQDVTERKEREQQLERYETIVETTDDGVYIANDEMAFSTVNSALAEMMGYDRAHLLGRSIWEFAANEGDLRAAVDEYIEEMVAGDRTSATVDVDVVTADGETFPAQVLFVVRQTDDGLEHVGVVRDVTEQRRREEELRDRVEQQRVLSEFSQHALEDRSLDDLMDEAVDLVAETLGQEFSKVLEFRRDEDDLLLEAGHGWDESVLGSATFETERGSQAGYTLLSREPVVVEHFPSDDRFSYPDLLASRGAKSGISTIVGSPADPWGILETHTTDRRSYADYEVQFVQSIAHILYTAIRRREREQQLERYETIIETVEDGVYALDPDERFVMVNDALCEMTGYDREELLGRHASVVHSDETNRRAGEMSERVADEHGGATLEFDLRTRDGSTIPVESRFGPYRYDGDEFARTGVVRDVTERKRFEQTLTALHESSRELLGLETADAVCESVLRTTTDVLGIEGAGIYLYDDEASRLEPAALSDYVAETFTDVPSFEPGDEAITWRAFAEGETITFDDVLDTHLAYRDDTPLRSGIWIPLGDHGVLAVVSEEAAAFDANDEELADLLAATTEAALDRVERERERRRHERELEAQNERLDAFASMLAHELRNPLEIAQIYLDMGVDAMDAEDDASAFDEVERALDRIEEMIETLLVVTRRGGAVDTTEVVNLGEKAAEWWDDLDFDGTLDVRTDREIRADPSRLRQLLENLYRNAEEHGGSGVAVRVGDLSDREVSASDASGVSENQRFSGCGESSIRNSSTDSSVGGSSERSGDEARQGAKRTAGGFYVEDDGPGIPEDERGKVFNPGYSTSNVGIGFGLAVVRQLVDAHDWHCEITESDDGGARFEFTDVDVVEE